VLRLILRHRWWFAGTALAAVLLRLFFVLKLPVVTDDAILYGDIAKSLLHEHTFGIMKASGLEPTLTRLPGYPAFLAFSFLLSGDDHYFAAMLLQLGFDVLSCLLIADIARRTVGDRAARIAFLLAAFCPFLVNYVAAALTECLEIFCIAAALDCALVALERRSKGWWMLCGVSCAGAILLRPDGGLILGCIGLPVVALAWHEAGRRRELLTATLVLAAVALAPLVPWTIRNWRVFHVFQPLVTSHANDPGEFLPIGWERWLQSWMIDYSSMEDVGFPMPGEAIDPQKIPERAYNSAAQRERVQKLLDQYNVNDQLTPEMDRQFAELAGENIRLHPVRHYLLLPSARTVDMWMRPRSELLPLDVHFWRFAEDPHDAWCALALGALNLAYVAAAVAGAWVLRRRVKYLGLLLTYPVVRSLFLATTGAAEDRYTLECFPFVLVLAAGFLSWYESRGGGQGPQDNIRENDQAGA
jgi:4-amino-4-deoxy-L-arabinose transferase-like glycosyltransferase